MNKLFLLLLAAIGPFVIFAAEQNKLRNETGNFASSPKQQAAPISDITDTQRQPTEIMNSVFSRYSGDDAQSSMELLYTTSSGSTKSMEFGFWSREFDDGNQTLLKYRQPAFMMGSGVLIHSYDRKANLQWLYLSRASGKAPRKIAEGDKGKPLFGTDYFYIDIEKKKVSDFRFQWADKQHKKDKRGYFVIEAYPIADNYPYSKTISYVDPATWIEIQVDYYEENTLSKRTNVQKVTSIEGILTVSEAEMINLKRGSSTMLKVKAVEYNRGLGEEIFSFKSLTSSRIK